MNFADKVKKINKKKIKIKKVLKKYNVKTKEQALSEACRDNDINIVKFLINNNVDVNAKDNDDWTALMFASINNNKEVVEFLLDNNANVNIKNNAGWTTLMVACYYNYKEIIDLLKEYGAKEC